MITLPVIAPAVANGENATANTQDTTFNEDFLDLVSQALPEQFTLRDGRTFSLSAALSKVTSKDMTAEDIPEKSTLADLLKQLDADEPGRLSALLAGAGKSSEADKTAQRENATTRAHSLTPPDMQALSALFAMLPPQTIQSAVTPTATTTTDENDSASVPGILLNGGNSAAKTHAYDAGDNKLATSDKADDITRGAKITASAPQQSTGDNPQSAITMGKDNRDNVLPGHTAQLSNTPAFSTATVSTPLSTPIAPPVAPQISAQLGSQEWQQTVSQHVTLFTRQGQQSAELRLHPDDLGQIQISLQLDDNQAQLQMASPHSHVRAALEATLPTLRTALAESGIQLGQSSISNGDNFAQQQQGQQQQASRHAQSSFPGAGTEAGSVTVPVSIQRLASGNNAVDIFA